MFMIQYNRQLPSKVITILMCSNECFKKEFVPRKKKSGPYTKINAYTLPPACQQIGTLLIFIIQLTLHSVFVVPTLDDINISILWVLLGFLYALLIVIAYDYIHLTTMDPVDRLVVNQQLASRFRQDELIFCVLCDRNVHVNSHHCFKCDRCTEDFDHHCKFLNNCIGGLNYQSFFRLLCIYSFYNFDIIGQAAWVLKWNFEDTGIAFTGNQWGVLTLLIFTVIIELAVGGLLIFHFYISVCEMTTTLGFNYPDKKGKKQNDNNPPKININIWEAPLSANRLTRQEGKVIV